MLLLFFIVCATLFSIGFTLLMLNGFGRTELPKYDPHRVRQLEQECFGDTFTECESVDCTICRQPKPLKYSERWRRERERCYKIQLQLIEERIRYEHRNNR